MSLAKALASAIALVFLTVPATQEPTPGKAQAPSTPGEQQPGKQQPDKPKAARIGLWEQPEPTGSTTKAWSTTVHEAWLQEVLDLNVRAAVKTYRHIIQHAPDKQPERWLAVTRLAELRRLGIGALEPGPLPRAPKAVEMPSKVKKALLMLASTPSLEALLENLDTDTKLPPLHPATKEVQDWVRNAMGPNVDKRLLQRFKGLRNYANRQPSPADYAADVLRAELLDNPVQAKAQRDLWFDGRKPPKIGPDPVQQLADARERLQAWLVGEESSMQRQRLGQLRKAIDQRAETGPEPALEFLTRLPIYGDRLLTPNK